MSDIIIAECQCGKKYNVPIEKVSKTFRCKACGELFKADILETNPNTKVPPTAPETSPKTETPVSRIGKDDASAIAMQVAGEMDIRDPDELMTQVNTSAMPRTFILSAILHVVLIGATSFGLYSDWSRFGVMMPGAIREKKREIAEEVRRKSIQEERERREAERQAEAEKAADAMPKPTPTAAATSASDDEKTEYQLEVEEVRKDRPAASSLRLDLNDLTIE